MENEVHMENYGSISGCFGHDISYPDMGCEWGIVFLNHNMAMG
jgi:hypothetical protein